MKRHLFEPDHELYRETLRAFMDSEVVPHYKEWTDEGIVPRSLFTKMGALGALSFGVPEEFGGSGEDDYRYNAILSEESVRAQVGPAMVGPGLHIDIVIPYIVSMATDEQKARWLPGMVLGETIGAIAMTEPGTGSDLSGIRTKAVRDGDDWIVNGSKIFITNGINADLVVVAVRTGEHPHKGLSLLVLERGMPGFERGRKLDKVGMHVQDTAELSFTDVRVPAANMLGAEGDGFLGLSRNLAQERLGIAVGAVANAEVALHLIVDYVRDRRAFGNAIGSFQNTRFKIAEMSTEFDIARAYVDDCVRAHLVGELTPVDAAKAKWWTTEMLGRLLDQGVQLHGGYGYMQEYPISQMWTDNRVSRIYGGTTEIMKDLIGRSMRLDRPE